jgi:hypothetical protein
VIFTFSGWFQEFLFILISRSLTMTCLGVVFFVFVLFGVSSFESMYIFYQIWGIFWYLFYLHSWNIFPILFPLLLELHLFTWLILRYCLQIPSAWVCYFFPILFLFSDWIVSTDESPSSQALYSVISIAMRPSDEFLISDTVFFSSRISTCFSYFYFSTEISNISIHLQWYFPLCPWSYLWWLDHHEEKTAFLFLTLSSNLGYVMSRMLGITKCILL